MPMVSATGSEPTRARRIGDAGPPHRNRIALPRSLLPMNTTDRVTPDVPDTFRARRRAPRMLRPLIAGAAALALVGSLAACATTTTDTSTSSDTTTTVTVDAASADSNTAEVVAAAEAFLATLDDDQIAELSYDYSDTADKENWSNLPEGQVSRGGLAVGDMTDEQYDALLVLLQAMLSDDGYQQVLDTMGADDVLGASQGGGGGGGGLSWSSDLYFLSFFGTPSTDSAFAIQFGGHHLALLLDYQGDTVTMTPEFLGVEPQEYTSDDGETVETMANQKEAVFALLGALTDEELAAAELDAIYDDVVMGPGADDGDYPSETGVLVSDLTQEQQDLVTAAITAWVGVADESVSDAIVAEYVAQYDETYVMWSGSTDSDSTDAYFRISGPQVWIEYVHQNGVGFAGIHLHSVYRDKLTDYGA